MKNPLLISAVLFSKVAFAKPEKLIFVRVSESLQAKSTCSIYSSRVELKVEDKQNKRLFKKKITESSAWPNLIFAAQKNTLLKSVRALENTNSAYMAYTSGLAKEVYLKSTKGIEVLSNSSWATAQIIDIIDAECEF